METLVPGATAHVHSGPWPVEVVALGVPAPQHVAEPAMGYPNSVLYPGQPVGSRSEWLL